MCTELLAHAIDLELREPVPEELDAGAGFSLALTVACRCGCDLAGVPFAVIDSDDVLLTGELAGLSGDHHGEAEITITAPAQIGRFEWRIMLPAGDIAGIPHDEASLAFSFETKPHATSLAVWDNPSPVVIGEKFTLKVGAKCTASCSLTGKGVDICDEAGVIVARGTLGDAPWRDTAALFWTSVELVAPAGAGSFSWSARFSSEELQLPHGAASSAFRFLTVPPPEHSVCVKVVEKGTDIPLDNAEVRLGVYREATDETGLARFAVATGEHTLFIWKAGYDAPARAIEVNENQDVRVEAVILPKEDPDAFWQG